jgi:carbon dioxide concentrating mechanism protein CcmN
LNCLFPLTKLKPSMPLLPLQPIGSANFYMSGDVTIQEGAAIAPGAILQADSGSRIIIRSGACIGMGVVLHAHHGTIEVGAGATLGAAVLAIGNVKIGAHTCVGASTTIWNRDIAADAVVPPGSLVTDSGKQVIIADESPPPLPESQETPPESVAPPPPVDPTLTEEAIAFGAGHCPIAPPVPPPVPESPTANPGIPIYGQVSLNQLLITLFPHKQSSPPPEQSG